MKGTFEADFSEFKDEADAAALKLRAFEAAGSTVNTSLGRLTDSLGKFDSVLASVGFRFSTALRGLDEIANATGQTTTQLGALSSAGLVVGAAMAGWDLGRRIAEWTKADQVIGDATAKLLGWGDAAGERAAAKMDVLAKATAIAGRNITDLNEAMRINAEFTTKAADDLQRYSDEWNRARESLHHFIDEGNREFDEQEKKREARVAKQAADNKRGLEEYERGLLREFDIELSVWTAANKLTDDLNVKMQKKLELQTAFVTQLTLERAKAVESNAARALGSGVSDPALVASTKRDAALADIEASRARAPAFDFGPLVEKVWRDFDEQILKRGNTLAPAPPTTVNVSGVLDPRTIQELATAVSEAQMRASGRLWPGR